MHFRFLTCTTTHCFDDLTAPHKSNMVPTVRFGYQQLQAVSSVWSHARTWGPSFTAPQRPMLMNERLNQELAQLRCGVGCARGCAPSKAVSWGWAKLGILLRGFHHSLRCSQLLVPGAPTFQQNQGMIRGCQELQVSCSFGRR